MHDDQSNNLVQFHTDIRSAKISELKYNNNSYFVFYDTKLKIQLRISTHSIINHKNKITEKAWGETQLKSRKCYLTGKIPGAITQFPEDGIPIKFKNIEPSKNQSEKGYDNFAVIENKIKNIEWLFLASSGHRRLKIAFNKNETKYDWLIP